MSNMSYCRFTNTASDLADCLRNWRSLNPDDHGGMVDEERENRKWILAMAKQLVDEFEDDIDERDEYWVEIGDEDWDEEY